MHEKPGSVYQTLSFNMDNACTVMHTDKNFDDNSGTKAPTYVHMGRKLYSLVPEF